MGSRTRWHRFARYAPWAVVLAVGAACAGTCWYVYSEPRATTATPAGVTRFEVREVPLAFTPAPLPDAVPGPRLRFALQSVRPYFEIARTANRVPVPHIIHALRLWGVESEFPDLTFDLRVTPGFGGRRMLATLLEHDEFARLSSYKSPGMLYTSPYGIQVVCAADPMYGAIDTSSHLGKLGQVCGEVGVPSTHPVRTSDGATGTVADILRDDAARIVSGAEIDFVVCGLCRYAASGAPWVNRFGQTCDFDQLARSLLSRSPADGACDGIAKYHALACLARAADQTNLISPAIAADIRVRLTAVSRALEKCQKADGAWAWDWPQAEYPQAQVQRMNYRNPLTGAYLVTGHHLEWMAIAPPECRPNDESIQLALTYLLRNWEAANDELLSDWRLYALFSHAARAVWLFSGKQSLAPYERG